MTSAVSQTSPASFYLGGGLVTKSCLTLGTPWTVAHQSPLSTGAPDKNPGEVAQSCLTLCDPMYCSPPGFSVHGILQARILEWVAMPSSWVSSQPRDQTQVSHIAGGFFTS